MHIVIIFLKKKERKKEKYIHTCTLKEVGLVCAMKGTHDL